MNDAGNLLRRRFEGLDIKPSEFGHEDHVRTAYEMLDHYDFVDACSRYALTIKAMADSAGAPKKYNATITFAFMSLIAERKSKVDCAGADAFLRANPDLLERRVLHAWYTAERLTSDLARKQFLLPDPVIGERHEYPVR